MHLTGGNQRLDLAYCTNIHRGETWSETLDAMTQYTLAVRDRVSPGKPYAIGLRLSDRASRELNERKTLLSFERWLEKNNCYIFTINGFPFGQFHGTRVKEQVYAPDWTSPERLEYTNRLFDILAELAHDSGSVSTVPCSFKEFIKSPEQETAMRDNLWKCVEHIASLSEKTDIDFHLGLEPEPLCYLETSYETAEFIERMREDRPGDDRLNARLGVNYDTCHLAVEYETPQEAIARFCDYGVRISKIHLSSALKVQFDNESRDALQKFADDVYFHQVIQRDPEGQIKRFRDLDVALRDGGVPGAEWRIHFHIPLHHQPTALFANTADHMLGVLDVLQSQPGLCSHFEMETYTWEVMPPELKQRSVVDQLADEYAWTLKEFARRGLSTAE